MAKGKLNSTLLYSDGFKEVVRIRKTITDNNGFRFESSYAKDNLLNAGSPLVIEDLGVVA